MARKNSFAKLFASYKTYNPAKEGFGSPEDWLDGFNERLGRAEAMRILGGFKPTEVLGIGARPTWEEARSAYRAKAMRYHPDRLAQTGIEAEVAKVELEKVKAAWSLLDEALQD